MTNAISYRPESIVFDCDGVRVDSEPIANRILAEAIADLGWPLSVADCIARFKGHHFDMVVAAVEARIGRPVPGVIQVLGRIAQSGLATCVASQGPLGEDGGLAGRHRRRRAPVPGHGGAAGPARAGVRGSKFELGWRRILGYGQ